MPESEQGNTRTLRDRAEALAPLIDAFPILQRASANDLIDLVTYELGDPQILDEFRSIGEHPTASKALAPRNILHVFSGNTPHAALQSLIRGLLVGSHNFCKLPSSGLPEIVRFVECLPDWLAGRVEFSTDLRGEWLDICEAWIVFGNDETIEVFSKMACERGVHVFQPHGNKAGLAIISDGDSAFPSARTLAESVCQFDQQGCLSPHTAYFADSGMAEDFAGAVARHMDEFGSSSPRAELTLSEQSAIHEAREEARLHAAMGEKTHIFESESSTDWTVVYEEYPGFRFSPLNRFIYLKPLPDDLRAALQSARGKLSCCGFWGEIDSHLSALADNGVSRVCPLDRMHIPPWNWRQDNMPTLAPLVSWIDLERA